MDRFLLRLQRRLRSSSRPIRWHGVPPDLLTDALADPGPEDWADMSVPAQVDLKAVMPTASSSVSLRALHTAAVIVILVGEPPREGQATQVASRLSTEIWEMVQAVQRGQRVDDGADDLFRFSETTDCFSRSSCSGLRPTKALPRSSQSCGVSSPRRSQASSVSWVSIVLPCCCFCSSCWASSCAPSGPGDIEIVELSSGLPAAHHA